MVIKGRLQYIVEQYTLQCSTASVVEWLESVLDAAKVGSTPAQKSGKIKRMSL